MNYLVRNTNTYNIWVIEFILLQSLWVFANSNQHIKSKDLAGIPNLSTNGAENIPKSFNNYVLFFFKQMVTQQLVNCLVMAEQALLCSQHPDVPLNSQGCCQGTTMWKVLKKFKPLFKCYYHKIHC